MTGGPQNKHKKKFPTQTISIALPAVVLAIGFLYLLLGHAPWVVGDGLPITTDGLPAADETHAHYIEIVSGQIQSLVTLLQSAAFGLCVVVGVSYRGLLTDKAPVGAVETICLSIFVVAMFLTVYFSYWTLTALFSQTALNPLGFDVLFIRNYTSLQALSLFVAAFCTLVLILAKAYRAQL